MERRRSDGICSRWPNEQGLEIKELAALVLGLVWRPSSKDLARPPGPSTDSFTLERNRQRSRIVDQAGRRPEPFDRTTGQGAESEVPVPLRIRQNGLSCTLGDKWAW